MSKKESVKSSGLRIVPKVNVLNPSAWYLEKNLSALAVNVLQAGVGGGGGGEHAGILKLNS